MKSSMLTLKQVDPLMIDTMQTLSLEYNEFPAPAKDHFNLDFQVLSIIDQLVQPFSFRTFLKKFMMMMTQ